MYKPIRTLVSSAVLAAIASTAAHSGAFSLYTEGNGYSIGNYGAGVAAEAKDASTAWYNPAGLALIKDHQAVVGGVVVLPSSKLSGTSTYTTSIPPPIGNLTYTQNFSGIDGGQNAVVPSFHYAHSLGERATFGLSVVSPFGLSTFWDKTSPVRYAAEKSELIVINLTPSIGGKLTEQFFIGAGIDLQYARVKFNSILGSPALADFLVGVGPRGLDSLSYNKGHSTGVGFHAGGMIVWNDNHTRVGLNYQSKVKHKFNGYSELRGPLANTTTNVFLVQTWANGKFRVNNLQSNRIEFPEIVTLSGYHDVNDRVAVLGSVVFTGWHVLRAIELKNVAAGSPSAAGFITNVTVNSTSSENYRNAWRGALGANVRVDERWLVRVGGGYDQTPTRDQFRTVRLPDANRWALAAGVHCQYSPDIGVDVSYAYLWSDGTSIINKTQTFNTTNSFNVRANAKAHSHLLGAQLVWKIDGVDDKQSYKK